MDPQLYPDIHPDAFVHERDRAALAAMRAVPGLDTLIKLLTRSTIEDEVHAWRTATTIQLGSCQYPSLYRMVTRACDTFGIEVPEVYLQNSPIVNAWAFGYNRYTITLHSALVDTLEDREVQAVAGHEVGHIACEHMLYKTTADIIIRLGTVALGPILGNFKDLLTVPVELALLTWSRAAEYSCDRAALLVTGDPEPVASAMARLAGGSGRFRDEFSLEQVLAQARGYKGEGRSFGKLKDAIRQMMSTHPDPVLRALAITEWAESPEYAAIRAGRYPTRTDASLRSKGTIEGIAYCPACHGPLGEAPACPACGLRMEARYQRACPRDHVNDVQWRFCRTCGAALEER